MKQGLLVFLVFFWTLPGHAELSGMFAGTQKHNGDECRVRVELDENQGTLHLAGWTASEDEEISGVYANFERNSSGLYQLVVDGLIEQYWVDPEGAVAIEDGNLDGKISGKVIYSETGKTFPVRVTIRIALKSHRGQPESAKLSVKVLRIPLKHFECQNLKRIK